MLESMGDVTVKRVKLRPGNLISAGLCVVSICIIGYCLYVYLHMTFYVMPAADDFTISADIRNSRLLGEGFLRLSLKWMCKIYFTWQGTFVSNFLLYFVAPYVRFGSAGIRIFCASSIFLFYGSFWMLIHCIMKYLLKCKGTVIFFACAFITWLISNARITMEVFFWYNGICVYTIPLIFTLCGVRFFIKYIFVDEQKRNFVGAVVFGFLACGGVLQCSAVVCFIYLLICIWGFTIEHPRRKRLSIAFAVVLISSLINCLAPGNFTRRGVINEAALPVFRAVEHSLENVLEEFVRLCTKTDMPYLLLVMLLMGFFYNYNNQQIRVKIWMIVLCGLGVFLCMLVCCYPVALGYSSRLMEPRGYFIVDVFLIIGIMLCMFMLGGWLWQMREYHTSKNRFFFGSFIVAICMICMTLNTMIPAEKIERPILMCVEDDKQGHFVRFRDMWESILKQIEETDEVYVTVRSQLIPSPQELKNPDLSSDPDYWINVGAAKYFGKETVQIEWMK